MYAKWLLVRGMNNPDLKRKLTTKKPDLKTPRPNPNLHLSYYSAQAKGLNRSVFFFSFFSVVSQIGTLETDWSQVGNLEMLIGCQSAPLRR